jgi:hypothetical protein
MKAIPDRKAVKPESPRSKAKEISLVDTKPINRPKKKKPPTKAKIAPITKMIVLFIIFHTFFILNA